MAGMGRQEILRRWGRRLGVDRLTERERRMVAGGGALVVLVLAVELLVLPFWQARLSLQRSVNQRQGELTEVLTLSRQYRELEQRHQGVAEKIAGRSPDFSLFAFVEQQAERAGTRRQIGFIRPSSTSGESGSRLSGVEVKVQQIGLEPLVRFLRLVESGQDAVAIRRIAIQESGGSGLLDASFQVVALEKTP